MFMRFKYHNHSQPFEEKFVTVPEQGPPGLPLYPLSQTQPVSVWPEETVCELAGQALQILGPDW